MPACIVVSGRSRTGAVVAAEVAIDVGVTFAGAVGDAVGDGEGVGSSGAIVGPPSMFRLTTKANVAVMATTTAAAAARPTYREIRAVPYRLLPIWRTSAISAMA